MQINPNLSSKNAYALFIQFNLYYRAHIVKLFQLNPNHTYIEYYFFVKHILNLLSIYCKFGE